MTLPLNDLSILPWKDSLIKVSVSDEWRTCFYAVTFFNPDLTNALTDSSLHWVGLRSNHGDEDRKKQVVLFAFILFNLIRRILRRSSIRKHHQ